MVLNSITAVAVSILALYGIASVLRGAGLGGGLITLAVQQIVMVGASFALFTIGFIPLVTSIVMLALPIGLRIIAIIWFYRMANRILDGAYGDEAMWAAELARDDDEFVEAANELTEMQLQEVGIEAGSKSELRELTIERSNEQE